MRLLSLILAAWLASSAPALAQEAAAKLVDNVGSQVDSMIEQSMREVLLDEMRSKVVVIFNESMSWQAMEPMMIDIYRKSFTRKEIEGMLEFYRTDAGRAVIAKMPVVMQNTMTAMQEVQKDILARMRALDQQAKPQP